MNVVCAPRALGDVDEILSYIHARNPRGAHNGSLAIEHAVQLRALNPRSGATTDEANLYRRPLGKYRYTIFYRALASGDGIEVARVVHGARVKNLDKLPD